MNLRIPGPLTESFPVKPEHNAEQAPKESQGHIRHDGRNVSVCNDPWGDEFAETITPDVLVDGDGDEDASGHRLI
jgi:hypothetical protein